MKEFYSASMWAQNGEPCSDEDAALNSVQHYLGTVDDEERKIATADAERMEAEYGETWPVRFCEEYGIEWQGMA
jgi:hypothetical protein